MSAVPIPSTHGVPATLEALREQAIDYAISSRAENTIKAYRSDWRAFTTWCRNHGLDSLPADPTTVALYLTDTAEVLKTATLRRRMSSIAVAHQTAGLGSPTDDARVKATWSGIRRTHGTAQHGKDALLTADIRTMVTALPDSLLGRRDACILLLGFTTAMRRSELVALDVDDLAETGDGLVVTVRRSKTDQDGEGRQIGVPYGSNPVTCPIRERGTGSNAPTLIPVRCSGRSTATARSATPGCPPRPSRSS